MSSSESKFKSSVSSSRLTPAPASRNITSRSEGMSRSLYLPHSSSSSSVKSVGNNFKRPKEPSTRVDDANRAMLMSRYLTAKLANIKLDKEIKEKSKHDSKILYEKQLHNEEIAEKLSKKRLALSKLELYLDEMKKIMEEDQFADKALTKLKSIEAHLDYLIEQIEAKTSQLTICGIDDENIAVLRVILKNISHLDDSMAGKICKIAVEMAKIIKMQKELDEAKSELSCIQEDFKATTKEYKSLLNVKNCIQDC